MFFQYENSMIKLNNKIKHGNILMLFFYDNIQKDAHN